MSMSPLQCARPGCGLGPQDPVHDSDSESYDHEFQRIVYAPSPARPSVWTQKGWWIFLAIGAAFVGLGVLLKLVL